MIPGSGVKRFKLVNKKNIHIVYVPLCFYSICWHSAVQLEKSAFVRLLDLRQKF